MAELKVRDLMSNKVFTVKAEDDLGTAYDLMDTSGIRHLPVVDDDGLVIAILTLSDLYKSGGLSETEFTVEERLDFLNSTLVSEVMTSDPATVSAEDSLSEAGQILMEDKIGGLPVVEGDQLVGILTASDFIRHVIQPDQDGEHTQEERNSLTGNTALGMDSSITAGGMVGGIGAISRVDEQRLQER
jgi:acetoin utilization protein AcuB